MIFYVTATIGLSVFFERLTAEAKRNIDNPIMALEFVKKAEDVKKIIGTNEEAREGLKSFLLYDSFAFVPLYFVFLLLMSFFLSQTSSSRTLALTVFFTSTITAAADLTENFYSYRALEMDLSDPAELIPNVSPAAYIKWAALFLSTGILSTIFWRKTGWKVTSLLLIIGSILGLIGLFFFHPLITLSLFIQLLTILSVGIVFQFQESSSDFLQNEEISL